MDGKTFATLTVSVVLAFIGYWATYWNNSGAPSHVSARFNWGVICCHLRGPALWLNFVARPMENRLKSYFVYGMVAFLAACQTPPASNQGSPRNAALVGGSSSPSSPYETEDFNPFQHSPIQWSHGGSTRGP
jgi:hypothetical protein